MIFIIADKPLEGMIEEHLPPMCDLRDYFSGITGHDLPPIAGRDMEGWMSDLPLRPDGGRWGLPRWGVPPICRPILRQGAVELVNYTNDGFIVSLKASTGLDLDWNCYVNQHDSGYGGSRLRPFVSILFAYWYLTRCSGFIGIYSSEFGFVEKDTPVASIDVSERKKGMCPIRLEPHPDVLYLFRSSGRLGPEYDTSRALNKMAKDRYLQGWYEDTEGLTFDGLLDLFGNFVYDVNIHSSSRFSEKEKSLLDPIEVLFLHGYEWVNPNPPRVPITHDSSKYDCCPVKYYALTGTTTVNRRSKGGTMSLHGCEPDCKMELTVFVDLEK